AIVESHLEAFHAIAVVHAQPVAAPGHFADAVVRRLREARTKPQRQTKLAHHMPPAGRVVEVDKPRADKAQVGYCATADRLFADQPEIRELVKAPPAGQRTQASPHGRAQVEITVIDQARTLGKNADAGLPVGLYQALHGIRSFRWARASTYQTSCWNASRSRSTSGPASWRSLAITTQSRPLAFARYSAWSARTYSSSMERRMSQLTILIPPTDRVTTPEAEAACSMARLRRRAQSI